MEIQFGVFGEIVLMGNVNSFLLAIGLHIDSSHSLMAFLS